MHYCVKDLFVDGSLSLYCNKKVLNEFVIYHGAVCTTDSWDLGLGILGVSKVLQQSIYFLNLTKITWF